MDYSSGTPFRKKHRNSPAKWRIFRGCDYFANTEVFSVFYMMNPDEADSVFIRGVNVDADQEPCNGSDVSVEI